MSWTMNTNKGTILIWIMLLITGIILIASSIKIRKISRQDPCNSPLSNISALQLKACIMSGTVK